jgi:hypothetical protein
MIARDNVAMWAKLSAPVPSDEIQWRQDGRPVQRDGKYVARFVAFIDAQFVRTRLDEVFCGEWDSTLELLPSLPALGGDGEANDEPCAFKCRLQILGVIREDVGMGRDYKSAATDAFKRAAMRFGIGHELYSFGQNWVRVDGDGRYAKPLEDPAVAYARRAARAAARVSQVRSGNNGTGPHVQPDRANAQQGGASGPVLGVEGGDERQGIRSHSSEQDGEGVHSSVDVRDDLGSARAGSGRGPSVRQPAVSQTESSVRRDDDREHARYVDQGSRAPSDSNALPARSQVSGSGAGPEEMRGVRERGEEETGRSRTEREADDVRCPKCNGLTWNNRLSKRNPKAPDYKCRNRSCDGVIWPAKANGARTNRTGRDEAEGPFTGSESRGNDETDQVPF